MFSLLRQSFTSSFAATQWPTLTAGSGLRYWAQWWGLLTAIALLVALVTAQVIGPRLQRHAQQFITQAQLEDTVLTLQDGEITTPLQRQWQLEGWTLQLDTTASLAELTVLDPSASTAPEEPRGVVLLAKDGVRMHEQTFPGHEREEQFSFSALPDMQLPVGEALTKTARHASTLLSLLAVGGVIALSIGYGLYSMGFLLLVSLVLRYVLRPTGQSARYPQTLGLLAYWMVPASVLGLLLGSLWLVPLVVLGLFIWHNRVFLRPLAPESTPTGASLPQ
ncbi:hypothetical protein H6771_01245 [Candidatus Peribacteria bacterium]|nr:hypothetical protein [Candidatus Peribacteria bacterium]